MNIIGHRKKSRIAAAFAIAALSLATAGCSTGTMRAEEVRSARADADAGACHVTGGPKVLARKVFVPAGVEASAQDGAFSVRIATAASLCIAIGWPSTSDTPQHASCPTPGAASATREDASDETMLAWESHDEPLPHIQLGIVTYDAPHSFFGASIGGKRRIVERTFFAPGASRDAGQASPALAAIGRDRFLLAWVDGNVESHELRAQSVVGWGDPLGPVLVLSPPEASVIGRPSVVVASSGQGLVSYIASIDGEFDVLATPLACPPN